MSLLAFALAGTSLMGLPPSGGFVGKWLLLQAAIATGQWWWALVLVAGGLLAAGYIFRVLAAAMRIEAGDEPAVRALPIAMELIPLALALVAILLGVVAAWPLALLAVGRPAGFAP